MTSINATVDDFDPLVGYSNYDDWTTPNPQDNPTWFNLTEAQTGSPWHEATYHRTTINGAKATFNFTSTSLAIYGAGTNFTITLDPSTSNPHTETISNRNATGRNLLYSSDNLYYGAHSVEVVNGDGGDLTLDLFVVGAELGGAGATLTNTTIDDRDPSIQFIGSWTQQTGPNFYNQTSTYTEGPDNAFEYNFTGSALYLYGDQVNDHGPYTIYLNGTIALQATDRSGCGGGYAKYCEKLGGLKYLGSSLPQGQHRLRMVNGGPASGNETFFDFDRMVITTPSSYSSQALVTNATCPFANCTSGSATTSSGSTGSFISASGSASVAPSSSGSAAASTSSKSAAMSMGPHEGGTVALLAVLGAWALRKLV